MRAARNIGEQGKMFQVVGSNGFRSPWLDVFADANRLAMIVAVEAGGAVVVAGRPGRVEPIRSPEQFLAHYVRGESGRAQVVS